MNYLDTSALIKRFVAEKGSPLVQTLVKRKGPIATAKIAYAEVYAGFTRKGLCTLLRSMIPNMLNFLDSYSVFCGEHFEG